MLFSILMVCAAVPGTMEIKETILRVTEYEDHFLTRPYQAMVGDSGFHVWDMEDGKVWQFDLSGRVLRVFGRMGPGPDEFAKPLGSFYPVGGQLGFLHGHNTRLSLFSVNGQFSESERSPSGSQFVYQGGDLALSRGTFQTDGLVTSAHNAETVRLRLLEGDLFRSHKVSVMGPFVLIISRSGTRNTIYYLIYKGTQLIVNDRFETVMRTEDGELPAFLPKSNTFTSTTMAGVVNSPELGFVVTESCFSRRTRYPDHSILRPIDPTQGRVGRIRLGHGPLEDPVLFGHLRNNSWIALSPGAVSLVTIE